MMATSLARGILPAARRSMLPGSWSASASTSAWLCTSARLSDKSALASASSSPAAKAATPIQKPDDFIGAIARPRRGDLKGVISALGEEPTLADLFSLDGQKLKQAGLPVKDRRYVLWCLERFRQGQHPAEVAYDVKPRKKIRGWGPRVQNGKRVRGQLRPGERYA